jgi:hypothetical protein
MSMPRALRYFLACYRALLWLYPRDLRAAYGGEMTDVLEQQLAAEWARSGARGLVAAGSCAIGELFTIAIPGQMLCTRMIAPVLSLLITSAMYATLLAIIEDRALAEWIGHTFLFAGRCR